MTLADIQAKVKAPKGNFNSFGKYKYRSAEDIVEAVKPVINPLGFYLTLTDEIVEVANRVYVKATATLSNGELTYSTTAFAREELEIRGMAGAQVTGSSSSYARKYALNGLFAIDDTKDADATNVHDKEADEVGNDGRDNLYRLIETSTYDHDTQERLKAKLPSIVTMAQYEQSLNVLLANQLGYEGAVNPSAKDINRQVRKKVNHELD